MQNLVKQEKELHYNLSGVAAFGPFESNTRIMSWYNLDLRATNLSLKVMDLLLWQQL